MGLGVWVTLLGGVLFNATAQLMLKAGTRSLGTLWKPGGAAVSNAVRIAGQPWILGGLACYVVSVGLWIIVLSKTPVSVAYPMLSIGYIVSAVAAYYFFDETLSVTQVLGIGVIIGGVALVSRR
jgi:multidrug transporter EmrE-like cation transporter